MGPYGEAADARLPGPTNLLQSVVRAGVQILALTLCTAAQLHQHRDCPASLRQTALRRGPLDVLCGPVKPLRCGPLAVRGWQAGGGIERCLTRSTCATNMRRASCLRARRPAVKSHRRFPAVSCHDAVASPHSPSCRHLCGAITQRTGMGPAL